jgi:CheY-like chemotaxis protein
MIGRVQTVKEAGGLSDEQDRNRKKVLVIDDEIIIRDVVQGCLEELGGWQVFCASSAREGLALLNQMLPDMILLDVMMPGMDGLTFLNFLKRNTTFPDIPVILLTVRVELTDRQRYQDLGLAGVISKPFRPQQLVQGIAAIMDWDYPSSESGLN